MFALRLIESLMRCCLFAWRSFAELSAEACMGLPSRFDSRHCRSVSVAVALTPAIQFLSQLWRTQVLKKTRRKTGPKHVPDMPAHWRDFWDLVARLAAKRALQLQLEKHSRLVSKNKLKTQEKNHD